MLSWIWANSVHPVSTSRVLLVLDLPRFLWEWRAVFGKLLPSPPRKRADDIRAAVCFEWESVKRPLCLNDCVHHWFGFTGRLFHSRGCCDAGCRALQQWLHAPWFVFFYSSRHGVFKRFSLIVTLVFCRHTRKLSLLFLCCMSYGFLRSTCHRCSLPPARLYYL